MAEGNSRKDASKTSPARLAGIGGVFILSFGALSVVGYFADRLLGTLPLFVFLGLGVGFVGGLYYLYLELKKFGVG